MDSKNRQIGGVTTALIVRHVRAHGGDDAVRRMLSIAGEERSVEELEDEARWGTFAQTMALFEAASEVLDDPLVSRHIGQEAIEHGVGLPVKLALRALGSPAQVVKNVGKAAPKFSTVSTSTAEQVSRDHAIVTYRLHPPQVPNRLNCEYTTGLLSQVSALFGLPPASVEHPRCQVRGDTECVFSIRWTNRRRIPWAGRAKRMSELEDEVASLTDRAEALQSTVMDLVSVDDLDEVLSKIATRAAAAVRGQAHLLAVRPSEEVGLKIHHDGLTEEEAVNLANDLFAGRATSSGSCVVAEVVSAKRSYGYLATLFPEFESFLPEEERLLETYARHAAVALDVATSLEEARKGQETATILLQLSGQLARATSQEDIGQRLADAVPPIVGCDRASVMIWDYKKEHFRFLAVSGFSPETQESLLTQTMGRADTSEIEVLLSDPAPRHYVREMLDDPFMKELLKSFDAAETYVVPILSRGHTIGLIKAISTGRTRSFESDRVLMERMNGIRDQASTAFENARLLEQLQDSITSVLQEIEDRQRAEADRSALEGQLLQSQKMEAIGSLAGGVAHDFNNLLSVIENYARFVAEDLDESDPKRQDVEEIIRASKRATGLTRQLLTFSRREVVTPEILDLNAVVSDMSVLLRRAISENIELSTACSSAIDKVEADRGQVEQILMNLAVNARDAMREGGRLVIETYNFDVGEEMARLHENLAPGRYVVLSVTDTGKGMTPEVQARIFEPFFTTKPKGEGTGLGLATVYGIVTQAKGHIAVASVPGTGTTFKIYLPSVSKAAFESTARSHAPVNNGGHGEMILVAEDEPGVRKMVRRILTRAGYEVIEAASGDEALGLYDEHHEGIDLVLTDVIMPKMSGKTLNDELAKRGSSAKTIYMSGYTDQIIAEQGMVGADERFIQKPFSDTDLLTKVRSVLDEV